MRHLRIACPDLKLTTAFFFAFFIEVQLLGLGKELGAFKGPDRIMSVLPSIYSLKSNGATTYMPVGCNINMITCYICAKTCSNTLACVRHMQTHICMANASFKSGFPEVYSKQ